MSTAQFNYAYTGGPFNYEQGGGNTSAGPVICEQCKETENLFISFGLKIRLAICSRKLAENADVLTGK